MKKLTILLFSILISFNTYSSWKLMGWIGNWNTITIDTSTIKEKNGYVYYWDRVEWEYESEIDESYNQADCNKMRTKLKKIQNYFIDVNGIAQSLRGIRKVEDEWTTPMPGTAQYTIVKYVCTGEFEGMDLKHIGPGNNILHTLPSTR
jgi:hypothetical protein